MTRKPANPRSLSVSDGFRAYVLDQLADLDVTPRSMFGGVGLYARGVFFAILARDVLYLKVDDANRVDYEDAGTKPFCPFPDRRAGAMSYYAVPVPVLESAPELVGWARKAIAAAERSATVPRRRRTTARR